MRTKEKQRELLILLGNSPKIVDGYIDRWSSEDINSVIQVELYKTNKKGERVLTQKAKEIANNLLEEFIK